VNRTRHIGIKFCGLTRLDDAITALQLGVDLLGFNFYPPSPRYLAPGACASLVGSLRAEVGETLSGARLVGVFVNTPFEDVCLIMDRCDLDLAQLSGDESPSELARFGERAYKAIRSSDRSFLAQLARSYPVRRYPPCLLVDAGSPGFYGGSGVLADWSQAASLAKDIPILLAGGLTPDNVADAIQQVHPWGVDVASGIELSPGKKDRMKMLDFIQAVAASCNRPQTDEGDHEFRN
jgi:phosphoribosylanthranilate isomerase